MTDLTKEQLHCLQHSLGLTYESFIYRNHYYCDQNNPVINSLIELGLMERGAKGMSKRGDMYYHHVTHAGKEAAWEGVESQKAYKYVFLEFSGIVHGNSAAKARSKVLMDIRDIYPEARLTDIKITRCKEGDRRDPIEVEIELGLRK